MSRTLVTYATNYGTTEETASFIAAQLRDAGHEVELVPATRVTDLSSYDAVVLGGPLYMGRWHREARRFVRHHRSALHDVPFAVFALGPLSLDEEAMAGSRGQLDGALAHLEITPDFVTVFGGVADPERLPFPFKRMTKKDARDWDAIHDWAEVVAHRLPYPVRALAGSVHA
jgi:menaquinone-dependent protoporphyrinogen oxidase